MTVSFLPQSGNFNHLKAFYQYKNRMSAISLKDNELHCAIKKNHQVNFLKIF